MLVAAALPFFSMAVIAAPVYTENFDADHTANWTVNKGPATTDEAHDFFFDYSTVGIPSAPAPRRMRSTLYCCGVRSSRARTCE